MTIFPDVSADGWGKCAAVTLASNVGHVGMAVYIVECLLVFA